jgi:hypothetical protein
VVFHRTESSETIGKPGLSEGDKNCVKKMQKAC